MERLQNTERYLASVVKRKIMTLDRDIENSVEAISDLRTCIPKLDCRDIPDVLSSLSALRITEKTSPNLIFLYETIVCEHGKAAVPCIPAVMQSAVTALRSAPPSRELPRACVKVVSGLAKHAAVLGSSYFKTKEIVRSIALPLLQIQREEVEGSAECLIALIETDAWKFVPDKTVIEVCVLAINAMKEETTQATPNMKIIGLLAEFNEPIVSSFVKNLLKAGAAMVDREGVTGHRQRRHAIQMIRSLMRHVKLDASQLEFIISKLRKWSSHRLLSVQTAALDILELTESIQPPNNKSAVGDTTVTTVLDETSNRSSPAFCGNSKHSSFSSSNTLHLTAPEYASGNNNSLCPPTPETASVYSGRLSSTEGLSQRQNASEARKDFPPLVWLNESSATVRRPKAIIAGLKENQRERRNGETYDHPTNNGHNQNVQKESSDDIAEPPNDRDSTNQTALKRCWRKLGRNLAKIEHFMERFYSVSPYIVIVPPLALSFLIYQTSGGHSVIVPT